MDDILLLDRIREALHQDIGPWWVTGSVLWSPTPHDVDVMVPASSNMRRIAIQLAATYRGAFTNAQKIVVRRADCRQRVRERCINIIQHSTVETPEQHVWCCLLQDGTRVKDGEFYRKGED